MPWLRTCSASSRVMDAVILASKKNTTTCWRAIRFRCGCRADPNKAMEIPKVPNGTTVVLTINRDLQAKVEAILDQALSEYGAQNGTILVTNPRNGEILAMAATPAHGSEQLRQLFLPI